MQVKVMMIGRLVLCSVLLRLSIGIKLDVRGGYLIRLIGSKKSSEVQPDRKGASIEQKQAAERQRKTPSEMRMEIILTMPQSQQVSSTAMPSRQRANLAARSF